MLSLDSYNSEIISALQTSRFGRSDFELQILRKGSIFLPPSDPSSLAQAERRSEIVFPPWLREFYLASDGMWDPSIGVRWLNISEVGMLESKHPEIIRDYMDVQRVVGYSPPRYSDNEYPTAAAHAYLHEALIVSEVGELGIVLVFPETAKLPWFRGKPGVLRIRPKSGNGDIFFDISEYLSDIPDWL